MYDLGAWVPIMVIFLLFSVVNISLASYKLFFFVRAYGPRLMLSQITLSLEVFANFSTRRQVSNNVN